MFRLLGFVLRFAVNAVLAFAALFVLWLAVHAGPTVVNRASTAVGEFAEDIDRMDHDARRKKVQADARLAASLVQATAATAAADRAGQQFDEYRASLPSDSAELADARELQLTMSDRAAAMTTLQAERAKLEMQISFERSLRSQIEGKCPERGILNEIATTVSSPIDAVSCRALKGMLSSDPRANRRELDDNAAQIRVLEVEMSNAARRQMEQLANEEYLVNQALAARMSANSIATTARARIEAFAAESQRYQELSDMLGEQADRAEAAGNEIRQGWQSFKRWLWIQFNASWLWILGVLALVFLLPFVMRTVSYYLFMPWIQSLKHLRLSDDSTMTSVSVEKAERVAKVAVPPGQALSVRSDCLRPVEPGAARTRVLYDWASPLVSVAAGLYGLTEVAPPDGSNRPVHVSIAPSDAQGADTYMIRVDLVNHPGMVLHPSNLVAVMGDLEVKRRWALGSAHSWATGQLRYIMFSGTGSMFLSGVGDVVAESLEGTTRQELHGTIVGFDSRLSLSARRTETFLPWLFNLRPLVEVGLEGDGIYLWQKSDRAAGEGGVVERTFDVFFSAVGKIFGF